MARGWDGSPQSSCPTVSAQVLGFLRRLESPPLGGPCGAGVRGWSDGGSHGALTHLSGGTRGPRKRPFALLVAAQFQDEGALGVTGRWPSGPLRKLSPKPSSLQQCRSTPLPAHGPRIWRGAPHLSEALRTPPALSPLPQIRQPEGMMRVPPQPGLRAGRASPTAGTTTPAWAAPIRS